MTNSEMASPESTSDTSLGRERSIRIASWLFLVNGVAWGVGSIPYAIYLNRLGRLPVIGPIESLSGPISSQFGSQGVVWFLIPMGLLAWVEVLAGWWLRGHRKQGAWLAIGLLPVSMFFWVGFLLPLWILLGPTRIVLILKGWRSLR